MRAALKGHVLDEMGIAALVVSLVQRAGFDQQTQRDGAGRIGIAPHRDPQAIG